MGTTAMTSPGAIGTPAIPPPSRCGHWTLYEYAVVTSTNLVAANLGAWTAVRADTQTNGRGRFQRTWVSDLGGLWLSAVVPLSYNAIARKVLPLAAGLAVCDGLHELGISGLRLRWPNDVLVNDRKLAGLLIDQFVPGLAVVGIGLNVTNQPEAHDPLLAHRTARLADLITSPLELATLTRVLLSHLHNVMIDLSHRSAPALLSRINKLWGVPRRVELDLNGTLRSGTFTGVDPEGRLTLSEGTGGVTFYEAHQVRHLTEIGALS
jgi:BirA family biotin operon repressor/biotin-[acetyl-CoA-carboxylase] ligase